MVRLTVDLIDNSLSYVNPLKERELDLRGNKIPTIENLGVATSHDSIDFTDNDLSTLTNFPLFPRLTTLLCGRNHISSINPSLGSQLPNLTTLVLLDNRLAQLADLDGLTSCPRLTHLVLTGNPVTDRENYRLWVLWRFPSVRFLDYQKVKDSERKQAKELFGTAEEPSALAAKVLNVKSRTFDATPGLNGRGPGKIQRMKLTAAEKAKVESLIKNAKSMKEITELERALGTGNLPPGILDT